MTRTLIALAAAVTLAAPARAAARPDLRLMPLPEEVRAGQSVELHWSGAPREAEELEILLSLDDGRTWRLRVSPEMDGRETSFRWRVPNLPAERARLLVRLGDDRGHEWEGPPGEPFRIVGDGRAREDDAPLVERGWWFGRGCAAAGTQGFAGAGAPSLAGGAAAWPGAPLPQPPALEVRAGAPARAQAPPRASGQRPGSSGARASRLIVVPLRN